MNESKEHNKEQPSLPDLHDGDNLLFDSCEFLLQSLPLFLTGPFNLFHLLLQLNLQLFSGLFRPLSYTKRSFKFFKCFERKKQQQQKNTLFTYPEKTFTYTLTEVDSTHLISPPFLSVPVILLSGQ